ncbi:MAG: cation-translocating P-type ATPase [Rhizobiaceae bacterium]
MTTKKRRHSAGKAPVLTSAPEVHTAIGLSDLEAAKRLLEYGPNELPRQQSRNALRIVFEVLKEPMLLLLLMGGLIYLALGDRAEAVILLAFAVLSVVITVVQEYRTERVLEALRDLTSPRALVIRNSERKRIAGREVVPGDILILGEGDRVPADAALLQAHDMMMDESLLTGESVPVRKSKGAAKESEHERSHLVFAGSLVVRGSALCQVTATGAKSEIGKIGQSLASLDDQTPRLAAATRRTVLLFAVLGGVISIIAVVLNGLAFGNWLNAALAGIALGMSMMPEEFPVVLTVFMAMGAWRISQARVLTRRAAAIETLGAATVLCTDKTGTLTENRMQVAELRLADGAVWTSGSSSAKAHTSAIETGMLASAPDAFDPMDIAFQKLHLKVGGKPRGTLLRTYGLRHDLLAFVQVWKSGRSKQCAAAKGAPEAIATLCRLTAKQKKDLTAQVDQMAREGLRVLGLARAEHEGGALPENPRDFKFTYVGLAGLADPLRQGAREAVNECRSAGIRIVMITGDYPETARAIAEQAGIESAEVMSGADLDGANGHDLSDHVARCHVFARISPTQKLRLVEALKARGDVVAMTGDGVNDAPSLKAAHIGIAMGGRGTDVAREASSMVLLDDDFGSIVKAVRLGRRIYDNLQKAIGFIFAVHVPIAGMSLMPLVFGLPVMFGPVHIAFLEMVIDPVCSLVFESESDERNVMNRPPRAPDAPLFSIPLVAWSIAQGVMAFGFLAGVYGYGLHLALPVDEVRSLVFFALVFIIIGLIFVNRSFSTSLMRALFRPNRSVPYVITIVPALLAILLLVPQAKALFRFGDLHTPDLALAAASGLATLVVLEMMKMIILRLASGLNRTIGEAPKAV